MAEEALKKEDGLGSDGSDDEGGGFLDIFAAAVTGEDPAGGRKGRSSPPPRSLSPTDDDDDGHGKDHRPSFPAQPRGNDFRAVVARLDVRGGPLELQDTIRKHMGSMALCRGKRGEALREAGAVEAVLDIVAELSSSGRLPPLVAAADDKDERTNLSLIHI